MIKLTNVSKHYTVYRSPSERLRGSLFGKPASGLSVTAVKNINLDISAGESVALMGRNGAGKSTLLKIIAGEISPTEGTVKVTGKMSRLVDLNGAFNPEFSGRENIYLAGTAAGLKRSEVEALVQGIIEFSELQQHIDYPVRIYSSGMKARLGFAVATSVEPELLIVDEILAVGDVAFRKKCFDRINGFRERGKTIAYVSHNEQSVLQLCDRAVLLHNGEMLADGSAQDVVRTYRRLSEDPNSSPEKITKAVPSLSSTSQKETGAVQALDDEQPADDWLPEFTSKSRQSYEENGASIDNVRLENTAGGRVNVLSPGRDYRYCYTVTFSENVSAPVYGLQLHNEMGLVLFAHNSKMQAEETSAGEQAVAAGQKVQVSWPFRCNLLPNVYYLNCGVTRASAETEFLHRITDALIFRVAARSDNGPKGWVSLDLQDVVLSPVSSRASPV